MSMDCIFFVKSGLKFTDLFVRYGRGLCVVFKLCDKITAFNRNVINTRDLLNQCTQWRRYRFFNPFPITFLSVNLLIAVKCAFVMSSAMKLSCTVVWYLFAVCRRTELRDPVDISLRSASGVHFAMKLSCEVTWPLLQYAQARNYVTRWISLYSSILCIWSVFCYVTQLSSDLIFFAVCRHTIYWEYRECREKSTWPNKILNHLWFRFSIFLILNYSPFLHFCIISIK